MNKLLSLDYLQRWLRRHRRRQGALLWLQVMADYALALARDLLAGEISLRAMSLVYTTLLSLVPLLALAFSLLKALGVSNGLQSMLEKLLAPLGPDAETIAGRMVGFVDNVKVGVLGSLGVGLLLYSAISLIYKVEASFNYLWEINRGPARAQRFGEYIAVLVVGPTVVFSALGLTASLRSPQVVGSILQIEPFGSLLVMLSRSLPYVLMVGVFSFLYAFIPNLRVKVRAALVGGLFAGVGWQTASVGFAAFVAGASNYNAIYSGFAILIFLLLWMYVGWLILLLGCRLAFYVHYPERRLPHPQPAYASREGEVLALAASAMVCRAFMDGAPAPRMAPLAGRLAVPEPLLRRALAPLLTAGLLVQAADGGGLMPGRDLDRIKVAALWLGARGTPLVPPGGAAAAAFIARVEKAAEADATSVREWLQGVPKCPQPAGEGSASNMTSAERSVTGEPPASN